jgi:translation initiation factor 2 alpha subunit (eIF-2alpha)
MKYHKRSFPSLHEVVSIRVDSYEEDYAVKVTLLEYDKPAIIYSQELSKKRVRNFKDIVRIGEETAATVTNVDEAQGHIDVSLRNTTEEDKTTAATLRFKHRLVYDVTERVSEAVGCPVEELLESVVWKLDSEDSSGAYNAFLSCNDPDVDPGAVLNTPHVGEFVRAIASRMPKPSFTITHEQRLVSVDTLAGPEKLTAALNAAAVTGVHVWIVAPPMYRFVATDINEARAKARIAAAVAAATAAIA